jgi:hypothetical protein
MKSSRLMFAAALVVRLLVLAYFWKTKPLGVWGINEAGGIARWLAVTHSFSTPFHDASAATAWLAPGYPFLIAGVFLVLGVQSTASAAVMVVFNALCSSLTAVVVERLGFQCFGPPVGRLAGWAWAMSPYAALMSCLLWETSLSALVLTYAFWRTIRLAGQSCRAEWAGVGAIWALAALVNPTLAAAFPFLLACRWQRSPNRGRNLGAAMLGFVVVVAPWMVRNELALHHFFPIRSNGWAEVYFGNLGFDLHPLGNSMEYQRLGEVAYVRELKQRVLAEIENHPQQFARKSAGRAIEFWTEPAQFAPLTWSLLVLCLAGLVLAARSTGVQSIPFFAMLGVYPLVYYAAYAFSRYRHPVEPLMYVLSAYAIESGWGPILRQVRRGTGHFRGWPFLGRGHFAITTVEIPPRGRKSPFTSAHTGRAQRTTSSSTRLTMFSWKMPRLR